MAIRIITQIGSLPYKDSEQAVAYSLRHDIPFLPELPLLGDAIVDYIKRPGQMSCLEKFKRHSFETVKVQCVGPVTLFSMLSGYKEYQGWEKEKIINTALEIIVQHITAVLDGLDAKEVILFLDEPGLGQAGFDFKELWTPIFESFPVISGVHCCDNMDWDKMFDSGIQIVSFDASQYDLTRYPKYEHFRQRGGRIAWGIREKEDVKDFRPGDLMTLPCGMGTKLYTLDDCPKALEKLNRIAKEVEE